MVFEFVGVDNIVFTDDIDVDFIGVFVTVAFAVEEVFARFRGTGEQADA